MIIFALPRPANDQEQEQYNKLLCGYMSFGRLAGTALEFVFLFINDERLYLYWQMYLVWKNHP